MAFDKGSQFYRCWFGFFLLGTINNLGFVLVNSSAQALVDSFNSEEIANLIGLVPAANVIAGFFARSINTYLFDKVSAKGRVGANAITMFSALGLLAIFSTPGPTQNFWFCLLAITILGGTQSFGESALVGYCRAYPPELVGAWSSGTGMAGMMGSGLLLALTIAGLPVYIIYYLFLPTVFFYVLAFWVILVPVSQLDSKNKGNNVRSRNSRSRDSMKKLNEAKEEYYREYGMAEEEGLTLQASDEEGKTDKEESKITQWKRAFSSVGIYSFFLFMIYFCSFVIVTGAADKAESPSQQETFWGKQAYTFISFLYQVGCFFSRSSLSFFKVDRIWIPISLQVCNMVLWVFQATYHFLPIWAQFLSIVFVGVCSGLGYVNICYQALNSDKILEKDRELCVNIIMFGATFGILGSSAFTVLMDATWLNDPNGYYLIQ